MAGGCKEHSTPTSVFISPVTSQVTQAGMVCFKQEEQGIMGVIVS